MANPQGRIAGHVQALYAEQFLAVQDPLIGQWVGGYRVLDWVGRGGMGTVYRAWDENLQKEVALKVLSLASIEDRREAERFQREARLAAQLDHSHVVAIYGSGQDKGYLYLAMELVAGGSLRQRLRQQGRLPVDQALAIAGQVLGALQAAHQHRIIHRDIKAENVLLQEDGTIKLVDFGVAKLEGGTVLTRADEILGTVEYMAPEQILGEGIGPAVDLYAVGVLLYEMLTGALPFSGDSPATLVYHQLNQEPRAPSFLNPAVSRPLDRLVLKLLDKLPENRYASAGAALQALEEVQRRQQLVDIPGLVQAEDAEAELRTRDFRPRFTGRQAPMQQLMAHFEALGAGGRVVFLSGEAGIGKSRLVEEWERQVVERGGLFIQGTCFFQHGLGPYMPFLDAVGNLFGKTEDGLSQEERQALGRFLQQEAPALADLAASSTTTAKVRAGFAAAFGAEKEPEAARQRLFDTLFALLATAAQTRPLVLVLEDMHWADEGSLQLLHYLARRAGEAPLLCLVTYEPEELVGEPAAGLWGQLLHRLAADGLHQELPLQRLSQDEVLQLAHSLFLEADFSEDFAEFLHAHSQGNPFVALEILKLLRSREVLYCHSGVWSARPDFAEEGIPDRVQALILRRVDQLDAHQRELLQLAAVIGPRFTSKVLEKAADLSRISLLKALFTLEKKHRLISSADGAYQFSHPKIWEVLYREIPGELRGEYHRIAAAILEAQQAEGRQVEEAELGRHLYEGEEFARAIPYLHGAGQAAYQLFGWRQAAGLFDQEVEACRQSKAPVAVLLQALKLSGRCCAYLGLGEKALERFALMCQEAQQAGQAEALAEAWIRIGQVHRAAGRFAEAMAACEQALASLPDGAIPLVRARALLEGGIVDFEAGRYAGAESRWQEALALWQQHAPDGAADALNNLAVLATVRGDLERAWGLYEQVLALDAQAGASPQTVLTYYNMGMLRADQERWDEAMQLYDRSRELCRQTRYLTQEPIIELNRAEVLMGQEQLGAAREACSRALRGFRRLDDGLGLADALRLYGRLCRLERHWAEGQTCLEKSVALNRQFGESISLGEALGELGLLQRESGEPEAAGASLREAERIFAQAQATLDLERVRTALAQLEPAA